ncbi:MAG: 1-deoxy-D-xylulose-5-phosphate synthase [Opitutales bacterium]|nr:1-deoxy-D-xylulose-5-phosphate synthase [Opitutales bacterium]MCH8541885.1 1-deoxy-D-xylulose-5-phosphate synthase [Opitutales bacterium]
MAESSTNLLSGIQSPDDVKGLSFEKLPALAREVRKALIETTSVNGGHLGPNLGVVELSIMLHRTFSTPRDQFVFDVSHQGYVHKLLTGRQGEAFSKIRQSEGLSGFLNREESVHDSWGAGHAGTALSAAVGMAAARDKKNTGEHVVALVGDAAFTCGITMEALNNVTAATKRLVVILNDNEWSIDKNVGAISKYLNELITNPVYNRMHQDMESFLKKIPGGDSLIRMGSRTKQSAKNIIAPSSIFEKFGLRYLGPIDGHDFEELEKYLDFCKEATEPVVLHVITKKGKGYEAALGSPEKFHGTSPFEITTGQSRKSGKAGPPNYQDVMGKALVHFAQQDPNVVGITAAMPSGTGLSYLRDTLPEQYYDVGIAEEHAVLFAGGLAARGMKPVCAIYSTFLQRAFDPIIHDICLQNLNVVFCLDRAGLSPNDGATHHGLFDLSYLRSIPNAVVLAPKDEDELVDMMWTGLNHTGPVFIRYPRGAGLGVQIKETPEILPHGQGEILLRGKDFSIWTLGAMIPTALDLADHLKKEYNLSVGVVNARSVKPLDEKLLSTQAGKSRFLVTLEDNVLAGGFGSAVGESLLDHGHPTRLLRLGWPDQFVEHGDSVEYLRARNGLDKESLVRKILQNLPEGFAPKTSTPSSNKKLSV